MYVCVYYMYVCVYYMYVHDMVCMYMYDNYYTCMFICLFVCTYVCSLVRTYVLLHLSLLLYSSLATTLHYVHTYAHTQHERAYVYMILALLTFRVRAHQVASTIFSVGNSELDSYLSPPNPRPLTEER